jgi:hypothetical protein
MEQAVTSGLPAERAHQAPASPRALRLPLPLLAAAGCLLAAAALAGTYALRVTA